MKTIIVFIPFDMDVERIFREKPPSKDENLLLDFIYYILSLITSIPAINKDLEIINGYVPIHFATIHKVIRSPKKYLDYLVKDAGILVTDNYYKKGKKSKGYKFHPSFSKDLKMIKVGTQKIRQFDLFSPKMTIKDKHQYNYLFRFYNSKLSIDKDAAIYYLTRDFEDKLINPGRRKKNSKGKTKNPLTQFYSSLLNIERLQSCGYNLLLDDNVRRLHSVLTNMWSDLRHFITYEGQKLVSVDLKNSQPYLSTLFMQDWFWDSTSTLKDNSFSQTTTSSPKFKYADLPLKPKYNYKSKASSSNSKLRVSQGQSIKYDLLEREMQQHKSQQYKTRQVKSIISNPVKGIKWNSRTNKSNSLIDRSLRIIMNYKFAKSIENEDVRLFLTHVSNGTLYEFFGNYLATYLGKAYADRDEVKTCMFIIFFTDNRYIGQKKAAPKKMFKKLFPTVYNIYAEIKRLDKTYLPRLLQRIESYLFLDIITRRIYRERPDLPIFTIHDSIVTTRGNEDYVKRVMEEELTLYIGIAPTLKIEYWEQGKEEQ